MKNRQRQLAIRSLFVAPSLGFFIFLCYYGKQDRTEDVDNLYWYLLWFRDL